MDMAQQMQIYLQNLEIALQDNLNRNLNLDSLDELVDFYTDPSFFDEVLQEVEEHDSLGRVLGQYNQLEPFTEEENAIARNIFEMAISGGGRATIPGSITEGRLLGWYYMNKDQYHIPVDILAKIQIYNEGRIFYNLGNMADRAIQPDKNYFLQKIDNVIELTPSESYIGLKKDNVILNILTKY